MPWYRMGGALVHLHMDKRARKKAPPACPFFRLTKDGRRVRCLEMAPYLCDWLGCNVPFCELHRLSLGPNLDVCPTHNSQRGLFSRLLPAPKDANATAA
jgi:hypothetical protein